MIGSPEIFGHEEREPEQSVNFVTCHDGFTLNDLVSYNQKHNDANGEHNRDGVDDNLSWNCGVEGETDDAGLLFFRRKQIKNFATILFLSQGVPMFVAGDEVRRTQQGNNNAYCQDSEISWFDWDLVEENADMLRFFRDPQTKEFLIAGTGQQHIEVAVSKMKKRYHTEVNLKAPKVPYRETIRGRADVRPARWSSGALGIRMTVLTPAGQLDVASPLVGEHNVMNLLAAAGVGVALGMAPEAIGRGIGRALWRHAVALARQLGETLLLVVSDPHAAGFYARMGAEPAGSRASEIDPTRLLPIYRLRLDRSPEAAAHRPSAAKEA